MNDPFPDIRSPPPLTPLDDLHVPSRPPTPYEDTRTPNLSPIVANDVTPIVTPDMTPNVTPDMTFAVTHDDHNRARTGNCTCTIVQFIKHYIYDIFTGHNLVDMANRARQGRPVPNLRGRVVENPLPFGGPSAQLFGSNTHTLAAARQNPLVTDEQWKTNIKRQANEIVRGQRGQVDLFYLPPPNTDSFEAESVGEFWDYIRNKIDGDLPAHAEIEDWSFLNSTLPGSEKSKAFNGRIRYWHKWYDSFIPQLEEDVSTEGKVKLKLVGYDNLAEGFENPNTNIAGDTKARTEYFMLNLDVPNRPGMNSYGQLLRNGYYEIVRNENMRGTYVCNNKYIDDPIGVLGKKFESALEKNIKKVAAAITSVNPNKIFDVSRSITMAVGNGAPAQRLNYDLVGKTFYVPGSAYDLRRKFENTASPERLEHAFRKIGSLDENGDPITSESVGSIASTSLYSQISNSPIVKELARVGANELPDNRMGLRDANELLGSSRDDNRSRATRARESTNNRLEEDVPPLRGQAFPNAVGYYLRDRKVRRLTQPPVTPPHTNRRLAFETGGRHNDVVDAPEDKVPELNILDQQEALDIIYTWFRDFAFHHMIGPEDINLPCANEFLDVSEITIMDTLFVLQAALDEELVFRIGIIKFAE